MIKNEENQIAGFRKNPEKAELNFGFHTIKLQISMASYVIRPDKYRDSFHKAKFCWCDAEIKLWGRQTK